MPTTTYGWRSLFWFGSGPPILIIAYRWWLPETNASQIIRAERKAASIPGEVSGTTAIMSVKAWLRDMRISLQENWFLFIYMVVLMTGFNSCSHGSQDLYPTFLKNRKFPAFMSILCISLTCYRGRTRSNRCDGYKCGGPGRRFSRRRNHRLREHVLWAKTQHDSLLHHRRCCPPGLYTP